MAQDAWNTRDPEKVSPDYTPDSAWRTATSSSRAGRLVVFRTRKWERDYWLQKNLWCFIENRIAGRSEYESRDEDGRW